MSGNPFTVFMAAADAESRKLLGLPGIFKRAGKEYARMAVITAPAMEFFEYFAGGGEYVVKLTATVRKEDFGEEKPQQGDLLSMGGDTYHVGGISTTVADPLWTLQLGVHK